MGERSVHEAAKAAVARALRNDESSLVVPLSRGGWTFDADEAADSALAALVTSAEVQDARVACLNGGGDCCYGSAGQYLVHRECFLAALAGTEAAE